MKVELTLIPASEEQFNQLYPLKDKSEMKRLIDEFNKYPALGTKEFLYVGYFIIDDVFNIIHIPDAKHFGEAAQKAMNAIVLPTINEYYTKSKVDYILNKDVAKQDTAIKEN